MWIEKYAEMAGGREGGSKPFGSDTSAVSYGTFLPLAKTTKDVTPPRSRHPEGSFRCDKNTLRHFSEPV